MRTLSSMGADPGRFENDLLVNVEFSELENRKPYRVSVWVWRQPWDKKKGFDWYASQKGMSDIFGDAEGGFLPVKRFRTLDQAVKYAFKVKAEAELRRLRNDENKRMKSGWRLLVD